MDPADAAKIVTGYTGLRGMAYQTAFPLITAVDKASGACTLSAPLPKSLEPGNIELTVLKYQPFAGSQFADGSANPACQETLEGWKQYVAAVGYFAKNILGDPVSNESGFDLEVWNEYTFGSQFLGISRTITRPRPSSRRS